MFNELGTKQRVKKIQQLDLISIEVHVKKPKQLNREHGETLVLIKAKKEEWIASLDKINPWDLVSNNNNKMGKEIGCYHQCKSLPKF